MLKEIKSNICNLGIIKGSYYSFLYKFNYRLFEKKIIKDILSINGMQEMIFKYSRESNYYGEVSEKKIIWFFWWQGIEKSPNIIKQCLNSIIRCNKQYEVCVIHKGNIRSYVNIEDIFWQKLKQKKITITHFSDILRAKLLRNYGGVWIDATIFCTDGLDARFSNEFFITRRYHEKIKNVSKGRWSAYFLGTSYKQQVLFRFLDDFFLLYHMNQEDMINYFLIDYAIYIAYENIEWVKKIIDDVPANNANIYWLNMNLDNKSEGNHFNKICADTFLHKLSWRDKHDISNSESIYSKFVNGQLL